MTVRYLVSALGVSMLCDSKDSVIAAMKEFVRRGGTPEVKEVDDGE